MLRSSKKILTEMTTMMFDHASGHCGPAKLRHKINHHKSFLQLNMSSNVLLPQSSPCQGMTPPFNQVVRPKLKIHSLFPFFPLLHIQYFSTSYRLCVQFVLHLSLLTIPTSTILVQATSSLAWRRIITF